MATFNAIFAKVPISARAGFPNSEIWIQGPEPYATKIADASEAAFPGNVVNGLQLDTWYDIYMQKTYGMWLQVLAIFLQQETLAHFQSRHVVVTQ
jgi:hypothetical protein